MDKTQRWNRPRGKPDAGGSLPLIDGSPHFLSVALPSREDSRYGRMLDLVKRHGFILEPSNRKWWLRDRHRTLLFLAEHLSVLRGEMAAAFTENFQRNFRNLLEAGVSAAVTMSERGGNRLDLAITAPGVSNDRIREALLAGRHYVEETDGRLVLLPAGEIRRLEEVRRSLTGRDSPHPRSFTSHDLTDAEAVVAGELLESLQPGFQPPEKWRERAEAIRNPSRLNPAPLPECLEKILRLYQKIGVAWMFHLLRHGLAGILADEMGLGKTVQSLALISAARRISEERAGPALVVCPASLVENWRREAERFTPDLRFFAHYRGQRLASPEEFARWDVVCTSYSTLMRDEDLFSRVSFGLALADEAQHVKNRRTRNARALRRLKAAGRFVLTGTPVENSLDDLVSIFGFLMPGHLSPIPTEARGEERDWHGQNLRRKAAPFILRRTKEWVAPELPEKIEQILYCEMEDAQRAVYESALSECRATLSEEGGGGGRAATAVFTRLLRLRQICCDPRLVEEKTSASSAKMAAFRELLEEAIDGGHRMLVFSQFVSVLRLLEEELRAQGLPWCRLDGQTRDRLAECDRFNKDDSIPVFLISLKAGGTGLNLTGADTVVHFDPWWNPAVEAQATARAHRIGQKKVVTAIKLIASGTVEEKVLRLQTAKQAVLADLFAESAAVQASLPLEELRALLE